jgi:hypothetical protein
VVRETGYYHAGQTRHVRKVTTNENRGNKYHVDALPPQPYTDAE